MDRKRTFGVRLVEFFMRLHARLPLRYHYAWGRFASWLVGDVFRYRKGYVSEFLCRCPYFEAERVRVNTERIREMAEFRTDSRSFQIMICTDGCGVLFWNGIYAKENTAAEGSPSPDRMTGEKSLRFFRGDTIFIPADSVDIRIHGKAELLKVSC